MNEILPGVHHWTTYYDKIGGAVHSCYLEDPEGGVLVDPLVPEEGLEWFRGEREPHDILLTNRHHYRQSDRFAEAFKSTVRCHADGMHEFTKGEAVTPFAFGDALPNGFLAVEVGVLCPEETAFHTVREGGILFLGDAVARWNGDLSFVPEEHLGDDPPAIKKGICASLARILDEHPFRHLFMAHGAPILDEGSERLRAFVEANR